MATNKVRFLSRVARLMDKKRGAKISRQGHDAPQMSPMGGTCSMLNQEKTDDSGVVTRLNAIWGYNFVKARNGYLEEFKLFYAGLHSSRLECP